MRTAIKNFMDTIDLYGLVKGYASREDRHSQQTFITDSKFVLFVRRGRMCLEKLKTLARESALSIS